jgi:hypothetical protein
METSKTSTGETLFDLTSYAADTHVSPSPPQAKGKAPTTRDTSGLGSGKPLANYDPDTQSWRMCEVTLVSDSPPFLGKWPPSGTTQSGKLFPQPQLVRLIAEIALSSWPTPRNSSAMSKDIGTIQERLENGKPYKSRLEEAIALAPTPSGNWPTPTASDVFTDNLRSSQQTDGSMHSVSLGQAVQMWPTPTASDWKGRGPNSKQQGLPEIVKTRENLWPTPTAVTRPMEGNVRAYRAKIEAGEMTETEAEAILGKSVWEAQGKIPEMWPTPTHGKLAGGSGAFQQIQDKYENNEITLEEKKAMQAGNGGRLNPTWVEWLMGFPLGWTDLED